MTHPKKKIKNFDRVVIGGGIFGLYATLGFAKRGLRVLLIEKSGDVFAGASYANQARIHRGYHYPRSLSTALKTAEYVERFASEYPFATDRSLRQIYAIAKNFSYTNALEFEKFCSRAHIPCVRIDKEEYFQKNTVEAVYMTEEYCFDAEQMKKYFVDALQTFSNASIALATDVRSVHRDGLLFVLELSSGESVSTPFVLNATYAGLNAVNALFGVHEIATKYELAELALCHVPDRLKDVGLTVMDGPFFSLMPFGRTGLHSLSSVTYTPHRVRTTHNNDTGHPRSNFVEMQQLAKKFLKSDIELTYERSLYAVKAIPIKAELDDARPTLIVEGLAHPRFVSVLSGKLNTIFDLDQLIAS